MSISRIDDVSMKCSSEGIIDLNSDVVNRWLRVIMEVLVDSDGVRELDRWKRLHMWNHGIGKIGDVSLVSS